MQTTGFAGGRGSMDSYILPPHAGGPFLKLFQYISALPDRGADTLFLDPGKDMEFLK
jgi:hypothetical protein